MILNKISPEVAKKIYSGALIFFEIDKLIKEGRNNDYIDLPHTSYYYSYPEFGKKWHNITALSQYHKIECQCFFCDYKVEYNKYGIGNIYLVFKKLNPLFMLLCDDCIDKGGYLRFKTEKQRQKDIKQLTLF